MIVSELGIINPTTSKRRALYAYKLLCNYYSYII